MNSYGSAQRRGRRHLIRLAVIIAVLMLTTPDASAEVTLPAQCRYRREDYSQSQWYRLSVSFATGYELNQATHTLSYQVFRSYAVIWFGQGEAAILQIQQLLVTGMEFDESALEFYRYGMKLSGYDKAGRYWEICLAQFC